MATKTLGLIGGMSWESTLHYYRRLNELVAQRLGGLHSAQLVLWSVDFDRVAELQHAGAWDKAGEILVAAARQLERAGADELMICANTMHRVAPAVEAAVKIPLIHLADVTADALLDAGFRRAALLGTRFTMEEPFYRERLEGLGLDVDVPDPAERAEIHRIIFEELVKGRVEEGSRDRFAAILRRMHAAGAGAAILGCTEFGMLIRQSDVPEVPLFDTTELHCRAGVEHLLG